MPVNSDQADFGDQSMITLEGRSIFVYTQPVDMRKSINGLSILLSENFQKDPLSRNLFLFVNRARNKIKCLFWDKNGFVLYYKRLEKGRFNYSKQIQGEELVISAQQLQALLIGLDFYLLGESADETYSDLF